MPITRLNGSTDTVDDFPVLQDEMADVIDATETKLGSGVSAPATGTALAGTGTGTSAWQTTVPVNIAPTIDAKSAAYTLALTDAGKQLTLSGTFTLTLPQNSVAAIPVGTIIPIANTGAGVWTVAAGAGATMTGGTTLPAGRSGQLKKVSTNGWLVDIAATYAELDAIPELAVDTGLTINTSGGVTTLGRDQLELGGVIASSTTDTLVENTTATTSLLSMTIPAGLVAINDIVRFTAFGDILANSGTPTWTWVLKIDSVTVMTGLAATISINANRRSWQSLAAIQVGASLTAQDIYWQVQWSGTRTSTAQASSNSAEVQGWNTATANLANAIVVELLVTMSVQHGDNETACKGGSLELIRAA